MGSALKPVSAARGDRRTVLVIVCLAQFMVVLDATIVNVALPSIRRGLDFAVVDLPWVISAYTLTFGGFLLLGGRAADLLGRRRMFMVGVLVFSVASLINALAQSSEILIGGRALQGIGSAIVSPAALSILTTTFPRRRERTRALATWSAIAAAGGACGLVLGGLLTAALSWRWIFLVNLPIGAAGLLGALRFIPESHGRLRHRSFDVAGAVSVTAGLIVLVYAIIESEHLGWGSARTLALVAGALALLGAFVLIERRSSFPLLRLDIFHVRSLVAGDVTLLIVTSAMFAMFFFASMYAQEILGYTPLEAGLAFLPITAGIVSGSWHAQRLMRAFDAKAVALGGIASATVGMVVLAGVPVDGAYVPSLLSGLLPISFGMGVAAVAIAWLAMSGVPEEDAGLASGLYTTAQQVGGSIGLAVLSTLAAARTAAVAGGGTEQGGDPAARVAGFQVAFGGGAILLVVGALVLTVLLHRQQLAGTSPADAQA